jgi:hypothetical protein
MEIINRCLNFAHPFITESETDTAEAILTALTAAGVINLLAELLVLHKADIDCLMQMMGLLILVANLDEDTALLICEALNTNICGALSAATSAKVKTISSQYLFTVSLLLLCRIVSIKPCLDYILAAEGVLPQMVAAASTTIEALLALKDLGGADSYDRHAFGLCITLLLNLTNSSVHLFLLMKCVETNDEFS